MKSRRLLSAAVALLLACLTWLSFAAGSESYGGLLLVTPSSPLSAGLNAEMLEERLDGEFIFTYEARRQAMAQAAGSSQQVTLIGTNPLYADILGYPITDGGFFTQSAMDSGSKRAVLNETAAFRIFGGNNISGGFFKLDSESWVAVGVLRDGDDENANIYAPAANVDAKPAALMALTDQTVTAAYVKNALKGAGIHETNYNFISLDKAASAFNERLAVALMAALIALCLRIAAASGAWLLKRLRLYRIRLSEMYLTELLTRRPAEQLATVAALLLLAAACAATLALSLRVLAVCLTWSELAPITGELAAGDFGHKLSWLRDYQIPGSILFGVCVALTAVRTGIGK